VATKSTPIDPTRIHFSLDPAIVFKMKGDCARQLQLLFTLAFSIFRTTINLVRKLSFYLLIFVKIRRRFTISESTECKLIASLRSKEPWTIGGQFGALPVLFVLE
jgi:hypothetical protein